MPDHVAPSGQVLALVLAGVDGGGIVEEVRMFNNFRRVSKEWNMAATGELRRRVSRKRQDPAFRKFLLAEVLKFEGRGVLDFIIAMGIQQVLQPQDLFEYRTCGPWPGHETELQTIAEHLDVAFNIEAFRHTKDTRSRETRFLQSNMIFVHQGVAVALSPSLREDMQFFRDRHFAYLRQDSWELLNHSRTFLTGYLEGVFAGIAASQCSARP